MIAVAKWYNNFQAPAVLMIDDLSDAYIEVYKQSYKNDWGYMCNEKGSSFDFLRKELLEAFPHIRITFFVPYLKHNVINENTTFHYKKFSLGERQEYAEFLSFLVKEGHEIAHHGSDHGQYIDATIQETAHNWIHEWALFDNVETGVKVAKKGIDAFKKYCDIDISGGKYCGYTSIDNSEEIIDRCDFLYWCVKPSYTIKEYKEAFFGNNRIVSFPTNFAGNSFNRLVYLSGNNKRDNIKKITKYFQPLYNLYSYYQLYKLYKQGNIISVQEHNSPSTSYGTVQSANIITDIKSLKKIFKFLRFFSIWYATCEEIATYIYVRENADITIRKDMLSIYFNNRKKIKRPVLSLISKQAFTLTQESSEISSCLNNSLYVANILLQDGKNTFKIKV